MYASTGDIRFKQQADYVVQELSECQKAGKNGLVCAFPDGALQFDNIAAGKPFVGVPWYTMHKIFAGLRDAHLYAGNRTALEVLVKLADWAGNATQNLSDDQFQKMLDTEHGGMNEVLADISVLSGNTKNLSLARRFCHQSLLRSLAQSQDALDGLHSNTQIPKVIGFSRLYQLTGRPEYRTAAEFFWRTIVNNRTFATGGNADNEHFFPPREFAKHLRSAKTMETCCTYNMLRLTRELFSLEPSITYADYYERALYNGILASQDPDSGMMTYFQATRPGYLKLYCTPTDSFWCCTGSGMENHAKYGDSIYFHNSDALYLNLFIASTLTWKEKGVALTQTTRFPEEDKTQLTLECKSPVRFTLNIRNPSWCKSATATINGRNWKAAGAPGTYLAVNRLWKTGDVVEVQLPMTLRTEPLPGSPHMVAILYGPVVLAGRLGKSGITQGADIIVNERTYGDVLNDQVHVPVLIGDSESIVKHVKPTSLATLAFETVGIGHPNEVSLVPYYRIAHERYNLYWKLVNAGEFQPARPQLST